MGKMKEIQIEEEERVPINKTTALEAVVFLMDLARDLYRTVKIKDPVERKATRKSLKEDIDFCVKVLSEVD